MLHKGNVRWLPGSRTIWRCCAEAFAARRVDAERHTVCSQAECLFLILVPSERGMSVERPTVNTRIWVMVFTGSE